MEFKYVLKMYWNFKGYWNVLELRKCTGIVLEFYYGH